MITVTRGQVAATKIDATTVATEASTLGFTPGEWPNHITVLHDSNDAECEGFLFRRDFMPDADAQREVASYTYRHSSGFTIVVYND